MKEFNTEPEPKSLCKCAFYKLPIVLVEYIIALSFVAHSTANYSETKTKDWGIYENGGANTPYYQ